MRRTLKDLGEAYSKAQKKLGRPPTLEEIHQEFNNMFKPATFYESVPHKETSTGQEHQGRT